MPEHGTAHAYSHKGWNCRCDACKDAWAVYMRNYRAKLKRELDLVREKANRAQNAS